MEPFEIIAAGDPNTGFDRWVDTLKRAGIQAKQIAIADYDRERGHNPAPHPRGNEMYVLVPAEQAGGAPFTRWDVLGCRIPLGFGSSKGAGFDFSD
jgi:hypothetical protein